MKITAHAAARVVAGRALRRRHMTPPQAIAAEACVSCGAVGRLLSLRRARRLSLRLGGLLHGVRRARSDLLAHGRGAAFATLVAVHGHVSSSSIWFTRDGDRIEPAHVFNA